MYRTEKLTLGKKHNILVITYWSFNDALIQAYTLPYLRIIRQLDPQNIRITLVTQEKDHQHVSSLHQLNDPDFDLVPLPYYPFGAKAFLKWKKNLSYLKKLIVQKEINTLHSWCTPAGMIAYLLHKKKGIRFIADSFEPHAEAMVENGTWGKNSLAFKLLYRYEKLQARAADEIITIAPGMSEYCQEKFGIKPKYNYIKPACTDLQLFSLSKRKNKDLLHELGLEGKLVALYAGKFGGIYLDKEVFDFFRQAWLHWKDKLRILLLTNESAEKLKRSIREAGLPENIFVVKFVRPDSVADYMGLADFAVCPVKPVPTKKFCSPIKTGEYWAMGLPVVITQNISNDSELIARHNAGYVWEKLDEEAYKNSVLAIDTLLKENKADELAGKIRLLAEHYRNFKIAEDIYRNIYSGLST